MAAAGLVFIVVPPDAGAQDIPRPSEARQTARVQTLGSPSPGSSAPSGGFFRIGKLTLQVDASLSTEFTDNVNQSSTSGSGGGDVIVTPSVGVTATLPISSLNTLRFRGSIGYAKYLRNSNLDRENLLVGSPDSGLSFDMLVGDLRVNFHDRFSVDSDLSSGGAVSGVAQLPRFRNTVGVFALWDLNAVILHLGYDHANFVTLGSPKTSQGTVSQDQSRLDNSTDQLSVGARYKLGPGIQSGLEATASSTTYPNSSSADFTSYSFGPTLEIQLTKFTHLAVSGGITAYSSASGQPAAVSLTSTTVPASPDGDKPGYYANLSIVHRLNRFYSDVLSFGHSDRADAITGRQATDFIRYSSNWQLTRVLSLSSAFSFENVSQQTVSAFGGATPVDYQFFSCTLATGFQISKHGNARVAYSFFKKSAADAIQSYQQNRLLFGLGFAF
jgi:hypothetical protein